MTMQTRFHSTYFGCDIWRQWGGSALPWIASIEGHGTKAADTLAGLRDLIRHTVKES